MHKFAFGLIFLTLVACGGSTPEEHIARAQQYLAESDYDAATIELKNALQQDSQSAQSRWLLGKLYFEAGDILSAEKELRRAQQLGWPADDVRPLLARAYQAQGKYAEVGELQHQDLTAPAAAQVLSTRALAALAQGDTPEANRLLTRALQLQADSIDAKKVEARILATKGDIIGALIVVEEVLTQAPDDIESWSLKGDLLMREQALDEARSAYDKAIALSPKAFSDHLKRALINLQLQDYDAAQTDASVLLQASPQHPAGNYVQGLIYFHDKKYPDAITALSVAEPASKKFPLVLFYLGSAHLIEGNREQAANFATQFFNLAPDNIAGRKLLATIHLQQREPNDIPGLLQPVLDNNPDDVGALNTLANALLMEGKTEQGLELLTRIAQLQPDSSAAQLRLGAGLMFSGQSDEATEHLEAALDINPEYQQADTLLVLQHLQKKDFEGAIEAAKAYQSRNLTSVTPLNLLGRIYLAAGQTDEARAAFEKALQLKPGDPAANLSLAQLALTAQDSAAAHAYFQTVLANDPNNLATLMQLAQLEAKENNEAAMVANLEQAMAGHPTALPPRVALARYYIGSGKPQLVPPLFTTLDEMQQQSSQVRELLALAQLSDQQHADARVTLEKLIASNPDTAAYHYLLAVAAGNSGDSATAKQELLEAQRLDENHLPTLLALARLALAEQDSAKFNQYLATLTALAPDSPDVLHLRAAAAQREGNSTEAAELAEQVFKAVPTTQTLLELAAYQKVAGNNAGAHTLLQQWVVDHPADTAARLAVASELQTENQVAAAVTEYQTVIEQDPDNVIALNNLAWNLRLEDPIRSLEYIRRAASLAPERAEVLDTLAVIEYLNGDYERAQRNINRALAHMPDNGSMLYHSAMIQAKLGHDNKAVAILKRLIKESVEEFPERAEAEQLLKDLNG